jgi:serine phosphatase RsbU (regulator of sigma subunit)
MMKFLEQIDINRYLRPIILTLIIGLPIATWFDSEELSSRILIDQAIGTGKIIDVMRGFYATEVVGKVSKATEKITTSHVYHDIPNTIPIPAAFSLALGEKISIKDSLVQYKFISDYPFTNRASHNLDAFETSALKTFRTSNSKSLTDVSGVFTKEVRIATPVLMSQEGCVACHNSHPESTKKDWKLGDVRGIQEVIMRQPLAVNIFSFKYMLIYFIFALLVGIEILLWQRKQVQLVANMNLELDEANRMTADSIQYASRIQKGLLPIDALLRKDLNSVEVLWRPRDVVGGDVYWRSESIGENKSFTLGLIDCTGHGVPGALMSSVVLSSLKQIYSEEPAINPGSALAKLGNLVRQALNQDTADSKSNDGFDAGFCKVDPVNKLITFSSARFNLFMIPKSGEVKRILGNSEALGYRGVEAYSPLNEQVISADSNCLFCMVSDGLIDQPGGPAGIAFGPKRLMSLFDQHRNSSASELISAIEQGVEQWRGEQLQRDDYSAIVFSI